MIDDKKRLSVNKTWYALQIARNARLSLDSGGIDDIVFKSIVKITRANIILPWKW
jgi:hypothetical protein